LRDAADRGEPLAPSRVVGFGIDLASALACAHDAGVTHRDVKPSNVRITPDDRALLLDFGLAHVDDGESIAPTQAFQGSPYYASPEQVDPKRLPIDARTDVYSLGVTLYECLTGRVPFEGDTPAQVFNQILLREPPAPRRLAPAVPRDLETVVL